MSSTASWRTFANFLPVALLTACATHGDPLFSRALHDGRHWVIEAEQTTTQVTFRNGVLEIDTPAGVTLWLHQKLVGPVVIEFVATAVDQGGPNDQVSDLNVFWMAANRDGSAPYSMPRSGAFADYNDLLTYYVGLGGNRNSTTRFRRYIGDPGLRPLLPEHDLGTPDALLIPNQRQTITLVAHDGHIEYRRDGRTLFTYEDPAPYVQGWFAFRTTYSHLRVERLRVYTLKKASNSR
jgi:hypothetical protein